MLKGQEVVPKPFVDNTSTKEKGVSAEQTAFYNMDEILLDYISQLFALHPKIEEELQKVIKDDRFQAIPNKQFQTYKKRLIMVQIYFDEQKEFDRTDREEIIRRIIGEGTMAPADGRMRSIVKSFLGITNPRLDLEDKLLNQANHVCSITTDAEFLSRFCDLSKDEPLLEPVASKILEIAHSHFRELIERRLKTLLTRSRQIQENTCQIHLKEMSQSRRNRHQRASHLILDEDMRNEGKQYMSVLLFDPSSDNLKDSTGKL